MCSKSRKWLLELVVRDDRTLHKKDEELKLVDKITERLRYTPMPVKLEEPIRGGYIFETLNCENAKEVVK